MIRARSKSTEMLVWAFKFDSQSEHQVYRLEQIGLTCYNGMLLTRNSEIVAMNGDWAFYEGDNVIFYSSDIIDFIIEPPLAIYGTDGRTMEQSWRDSNGT